jgi:hypothetical protein
MRWPIISGKAANAASKKKEAEARMSPQRPPADASAEFCAGARTIDDEACPSASGTPPREQK